MHRSCYILFFSLVIDLIAFTVILPLMPSILDHYRLHDQSGAYRWCFSYIEHFQRLLVAPVHFNNVLFGGLLGSWFCLLQFICAPILGAASDRFGRRTCLLFSYFGLAVAYGLWAVSGNSFGLFLLSRTLGGICKANIGLATAIMADLLPLERRTSGMALIGIAFAVGFTLGPLLGAAFVRYMATATLGSYQHLLPSQFALALSTVNFLFVFLLFEESLPPSKRSAKFVSGFWQSVNLINPVALFSFRQAKHTSKKDLQTVCRLGAIYFIWMFFYSGLEFTLTFLTHIRFAYTSMQQGKMYLFCGIAMMLIQGGIVRRKRQNREITLAFTGLLSVVPSFILIGWAYSWYQLYGSLLLYSYASSAVVPCLSALISGHSSSKEQGVVLGTFRSLGAFARALGPVAASFVFWKFGPEFCYMFGGLCLIIPVYLMHRLRPNLRSCVKSE